MIQYLLEVGIQSINDSQCITRKFLVKIKYSYVSMGLTILGVFMSGSVVAESQQTKADINTREARILGNPPRIDPLRPDEYGEEARTIVNNIRAAIGAGPAEEMPEYFATMARHPDLMQQQIALSMVFFNGSLSVRDRELAILMVAWLNQAPYEWGQHVAAAKREAGLTSEEIERITHGSMSPEWGDGDRAILKAVEEMHEDAMISDGTWDKLASRLNAKQLLELPVLVGAYQGTAYLQNSVRFRLMKGNRGLKER